MARMAPPAEEAAADEAAALEAAAELAAVEEAAADDAAAEAEVIEVGVAEVVADVALDWSAQNSSVGGDACDSRGGTGGGRGDGGGHGAGGRNAASGSRGVETRVGRAGLDDDGRRVGDGTGRVGQLEGDVGAWVSALHTHAREYSDADVPEARLTVQV